MNTMRKTEYVVLGTAMLAATGLLFVNVSLRYFFELAIFWSEEALRYLIVWITFLGAAVCVRDKSHISLDTLVSVLPPKARRVAVQAAALINAVACVGLCLLSLGFVLKMRSTGQVSSTMGGIPMFAIYLCMPLGFLLSALWAITDLAVVLRDRGHKE